MHNAQCIKSTRLEDEISITLYIGGVAVNMQGGA